MFPRSLEKPSRASEIYPRSINSSTSSMCLLSASSASLSSDTAIDSLALGRSRLIRLIILWLPVAALGTGDNVVLTLNRARIRSDVQRGCTHRCSPEPLWLTLSASRLEFRSGRIIALGARSHHVDRRRVQVRLDVRGVVFLDHLDACPAVLRHLIDVCAFHEPHADVGVP